MIDEFLHNSWVKGVGNIEHVVSITPSAFRVRVGKILLHVVQGKQLIIEALHRELIILGYIDV